MKRTRIGFVATVVMGLALPVLALDNRPALSFEGGMTFGNVATPADVSSATRTGYLVGAGLEVPITSFLSLRPELIYAQRGSFLTKGNTVEVSILSHQLEVPVYLKAAFGDKVRPYVFAGPSFLLNLSSDLQAAKGQLADLNFKSNRFDFAGTVGVGVELGSVFIAGRYSVGLVSVNQNQASWKSRGVQALLGVNI